MYEELEDVVARLLDSHLGVAREWFPHQFVPWSQGSDFDGPLDGTAWSPEQSRLPAPVRASLVLNLLTEDNLPSYHYEVRARSGLRDDGPWGEWVHRWTAEEGRHSEALRAYLHVTRVADPVAVERARMRQLSAGFRVDQPDGLRSMVYVTVQELATRIAHRNTGQASQDPHCQRLLARIALDENLHMLFYRGLVGEAFDRWPDEVMEALLDTVRTFRMPGQGIPGFARLAGEVADAGIYNLRIHHDDVLVPLLRSLRVWDRTDLGPRGEESREALRAYLARVDRVAARAEDRLRGRRDTVPASRRPV